MGCPLPADLRSKNLAGFDNFHFGLDRDSRSHHSSPALSAGMAAPSAQATEACHSVHVAFWSGVSAFIRTTAAARGGVGTDIQNQCHDSEYPAARVFGPAVVLCCR